MPQLRGVFLACSLAAFCAAFCAAAHASKLSVSANGRYLLKDGKPFFYLADTAWDLFVMLNREEAEQYLKDRAQKGFTVVMAMLIGWKAGQDEVNAYGQPPLLGKDPARPNEKYFEYVDYVVRLANSLGLVVAIAPSWSDWMYDYVGRWPHPFNPQNARTFGRYVGRRYKDCDVVWVIGGDRNPAGYEDILHAMIEGLDEGDGERDLLMTFHGAKNGKPMPPENIYVERLCASYFFDGEPWLDIYGAYSGHQLGYPTYRLIAKERAQKPTRPVIDLEPCYENHPYHPDGSRYWASPGKWDGKTRGTSALVREQAYWAVLASAAGHTYGCHDLWQFYDPQNPRQQPYAHPNTPWRKALHFPGATHMGIMRRLFESRPWYLLVPDQALIAAGQRPGEEHVQAGRAADGSFALLYLPRGGEVVLEMTKLSAKRARAYWFNPRSGEHMAIGEFPCAGRRRFATPSAGVDNDWLLVLDDAARAFPPPGAQTATS